VEAEAVTRGSRATSPHALAGPRAHAVRIAGVVAQFDDARRGGS
jgi:hypothetical protein